MSKTKEISASRVVFTSFFVDITDVLLNLGVAFFTGSVVVLADGLQGIADLVSSGLLVVGLKKSQRPANKMHPFGYGRELYFWTLISGLLMFGVTATVSIYFGINRLLNPQAITAPHLAVAALAIGAATNTYSFTLSYRRLKGEKGISNMLFLFTHSSIAETKTALVQDLTGALASFLGLIAIILFRLTGNAAFDGLGAVVIGLTLFFFSGVLILNIRELIIGYSAPLDTEKKIKKAVIAVPEVVKVMDLKTIFVGPKKILVSLEVNLKNGLTTDEVEAVTDKIQHKVKSLVPNANDVIVELESP